MTDVPAPPGATGDPCVRQEEIGAVTVLTLNRPGQGNALGSAMLAELGAAIAALRSSRTVRAVVLTGGGDMFCTGGDLAELDKLANTCGAAELTELADALAAVVRGIRALHVPVIAAVNGLAAGAGFSLALACDLRICADRGVFHFAYGALGSSTDGGMSWLLPRIVGAGKALTLLLDQPVLRAGAALELGLVSDVVPSAELVDRAIRRGRQLAQLTPHVVRSTKQLVDLSSMLSFEQHLRREHDEVVKGLVSADVRRRLSARQQADSR
ncbi:MAG TPA: enoyl-CoA hydratase/isomerase family protein [Pseudonocardiaceae bacterium]